MGIPLLADADRLQDPRVAELGQHSVLRELQGLSVIVGLNAAHEVGLSNHHFREQIHQRVLRGHAWSEVTANPWRTTAVLQGPLAQCTRL